MDNISGTSDWFAQDLKEKEPKTKKEETVKDEIQKKFKIPQESKISDLILEFENFYSENRDKRIGDCLILLESAKRSFSGYLEDKNIDKIKLN
jgi:hypothetical protein